MSFNINLFFLLPVNWNVVCSFPIGFQTMTNICRRSGGDKIYNVFDNQLPAALKRLQFDKHLSMDNVRKLITEADGYQPHLIAPEQGYRRLIESSLVTIKGPAEAAVDAVCIQIYYNCLVQHFISCGNCTMSKIISSISNLFKAIYDLPK
jgi:hypothetical protein